MVKRNLDRVKKKTKPTDRASKLSIEYKYMGGEPIDVWEKGYVPALNWYNYSYDLDQAREWILEYMKKQDFPRADISAARRAPKYAIPTTAGWIARMLMNGNKLEDTSLTYLNSKVKEVIAAGAKEEPEVVADKAPAPNVRERTNAKANSFITRVEELLDGETGFNFEFDVYEFLKQIEANPATANAIRSFYVRIRDEVNEEHPDIKEAYGRSLRKYRTFWNKFVEDCDRFVGNVKAAKVRKPRERKVKSAVDQTKSLKFMKEYGPLKIASVNPAEIIGAQQVWTYNTKYRKLSRFDAIGPAGIGVKGTTLIGFDEEKSVMKGLRKPEDVLTNLLSAGKVSLRKFMDEIKGQTYMPKGRMNEETIILRVIK